MENVLAARLTRLTKFVQSGAYGYSLLSLVCSADLSVQSRRTSGLNQTVSVLLRQIQYSTIRRLRSRAWDGGDK